MHNRAPLAEQPLYALPAGSIKPGGWLRSQLEIQAHSMSGHLDEFWADVGSDSGWLGGKGESWERGPYYVDGLLPLAWALDDQVLKAKAQRFIDWTLDHASSDGMIGPRSNDDWWPRMVMLKVLTQYHELTEDPRVVPVMTRYFAHHAAAMDARPLKDWGRFRWHDEVVSVLWLYNRTGEKWLLDFAAKLKAQGWDWQAEFANFPFTRKVSREELGLVGEQSDANGIKDKALSAHGVNIAMGVKASPVWSLVSGRKEDRAAITRQLENVDRFHGLPIGLFAADEHLAGRSPSQGVETCAVVEMLYSLELALAISGESAIADRIERIAYNALPAAFTEDMWAHQYDQQPNQIKSSLSKGPWTTNSPEANLFGLEPNFGCCTADYHQGWPKLTASLWMATSDGGLAAALYAPCSVSASIGDTAVRLREETDYPFRDTVSIRVEAGRPISFPLKLRIPGGARDIRIRVNGTAYKAERAGGFAVIGREWRSGDRVEVAFDVATRLVPSMNGSASVEHGPLLFVLPIQENWQKWRDRGPTADWQVYPMSAWNYALVAGSEPKLKRAVLPHVPFSKLHPAAMVAVKGRKVVWVETHEGAAEVPPANPAPVKAAVDEELILIPYGAAKLRITAFPVLGK